VTISPYDKRRPTTRVGVYVDAFNVYYGARSQCGRGAPGWRWLDLASLAMSLINPHIWPGAALERLVYCTAPRDREGDPTSLRDQEAYIAALRRHTPELEVIEGKYVPRIKSGVLVEKPPGNAPPRRVPSPGRERIPSWLPANEVSGPEGRAELLVWLTTFEEKGSDVNVASNLMIDVLSGNVDAAMVFSNDSDLHFPLEHIRQRVPVATINPSMKPTARDLRADPAAGAGRHWWRRLRSADFFDHQLPALVGEIEKPSGW
jgi:hypothetical protein